ncbi:hypothetical protein ANN_26230 [Periplaneta americana]|uniref:Uncharacterized protein n=1 Tax=Periplaneta americana TaxID=6978 RepID=A0ABQ8S5S5_PERAM|nr:hypothetical protein ANN_26230 [Periplaneta americana]
MVGLCVGINEPSDSLKAIYNFDAEKKRPTEASVRRESKVDVCGRIMDGWVGGWMDGWMDVWMDGRMEGRTDEGVTYDRLEDRFN